MAHPLPPRCAERFHPERQLAAGGFGAVWLATQLELGRPAAVKVLTGAASPDAMARFAAEARVTAQLEHPAIVRVIDHDVEGEVSWIAFE